MRACSQQTWGGRHICVHKTRIHGVSLVEVQARLPDLRLHRHQVSAATAELAVGLDPLPPGLLRGHGEQSSKDVRAVESAWHDESGDLIVAVSDIFAADMLQSIQIRRIP